MNLMQKLKHYKINWQRLYHHNQIHHHLGPHQVQSPSLTYKDSDKYYPTPAYETQEFFQYAETLFEMARHINGVAKNGFTAQHIINIYRETYRANPESLDFQTQIKEDVREITTKAGQKCTAVRRIIVPENRVEEVRAALGKRLSSNIIGDPNVEGVRMGSLAGLAQLKEVKEKVEQLSKTQKIIIGDYEKFEVKGADKNKGAFMPPIIFLNETPFKNTDCHRSFP